MRFPSLTKAQWATLALTVVLGSASAVYVYHARREARRTLARNHLKGILIELSSFNDFHGRLPHPTERDSDGNVLHSWRFVVCRLGFGDAVQVGFYGQAPSSGYKEPWDSAANARYYNGPHRDYIGGPMSFIDPTRDGDRTRFVAITGPGTCFDPERDISLEELPPDVILVVEVRNSDQHWMEPGGDLDIRTIPRRIDIDDGKGISGHDQHGFFVGFADGEVWLISDDVPFETISSFLTIASSEQQSRDEILTPYRL